MIRFHNIDFSVILLALHWVSRSISISNTQVWSNKIPVLRPEYKDWPLKGQYIEPINTNYVSIGTGLHPIINLKVIDAIVLGWLWSLAICSEDCTPSVVQYRYTYIVFHDSYPTRFLNCAYMFNVNSKHKFDQKNPKCFIYLYLT